METTGKVKWFVVKVLKEQGKSSAKPKKEQKAYREYKLSGMRNVLGIRQV